MSKRIGLITVLIVLALYVNAQQKLNVPEVDKTSYELFQQKKWKELIDYADRAREDGIDFFYLKARTGIAFYNLKRYREAADWFLQAWEDDRSFDWLQEYLYYSLVFGGRASEASKIADNFLPGVKEKIGFAGDKTLRVAFEAGYSFNPDFEELTAGSHGQDAGTGENYGEAFYLKNYHFESFDLSHRISPGLTLYHNFSYIGLNREERIDWGAEHRSYPVNINQFHYFINPQFIIGEKFYVAPSASFILGNYELTLGRLSNNQSKTFNSSYSSFSDFIFSTAFWSHFGNFSPGGEVALANINNAGFSQLSAWITWYPFSNLNFYLTPRIYFKGNAENSLNYNTFGISGGLQLGIAHLYANYLNGEMENFIESGGYIVANFPGTSQQKFSGSIYLPPGKKYQFVFRFISQDITEKYLVYINGIRSSELQYDYIKNTITAGISWNF